MKKVKHTQSKMSGKGFYIALAVSLLAVAIATAVAISRTVSRIDDQTLELSSQPPTSTAQANETQSGVPRSAASSAASSKPSSAPPSAASQTAKPANITYAMPLAGEIINEYSNGELVKSETMGDWRTHDGIDIASKKATPVKAAAAGTVTDISSDDMWGTTITINHDNNTQTIYCGLNEAVQVKVDQQVGGGDVIGSVGQSNQLESSLPEHLHFAMKRDGKYVNPTDFIKP